MENEFIFDEVLECIYRAIRGLERSGFTGTENEALDVLQNKFTNYSRDALKEIYKQYGDVQDFEIKG